MKSRVPLLAILALYCSAQVCQAAVGYTLAAPGGTMPASTGALGPNDFWGPATLPPVSAIVENGIISLVINSSNGVTPNEPSQITTRASDNRISNAVGPMEVTLPIKISDVTGLSAALSQINSSLDSLTATVTNLSTTVTNLSATVTNLSATVNTLSGTVSSLVPVPTFVDFEIPAGSIDGTNPVFTLNAAPSPASSLVLNENGLKLSPGGDYSLSGNTILFAAGAVPQTGDQLTSSYRH